MKLIQNKKYLLLVDEKKDNRIGSYLVAIDGSAVVKVIEFKPAHAKTLSMEGVEGSIGNWQYGDWPVIVAYFPLTNDAKALDLPLLPNPIKEDVDIEKLAEEDFKSTNTVFGSEALKELAKKDWIKGYKAAQSDKQFSLEDMKKTFFNGGDRKDIDEFNYFIQSLSTKQLPQSFIPEYDYSKECETHKQDACDVRYSCCKQPYPLKIENSQLVGEYKY